MTPSPPALRLHHVGYVVAEMDSAIQGFVQSLCANWDGLVFDDPRQGVRVAFLSTAPGEPLIELVQPAGPNSPVRSFLENRGPGLHHVCYEAAHVEDQIAAFRARRARLVSRPKPAVAFGGRPIAWVLTAEGLLVELLEAA